MIHFRAQTVAELLAIAVLATVGVRTAGLWRTYAKQATAARATLGGGLAKPGIELSTLDGITLRGQYADPASNPNTRIVLFLLKQKSAARDLKFWNRVAQEFSASPWLQFRGFCEAGACSTALHSQREVMIFQAGAVRTLEALVQADHRGKAVIVTAEDRREIADIPWRGGLSPARVRAEIVAATH